MTNTLNAIQALKEQATKALQNGAHWTLQDDFTEFLEDLIKGGECPAHVLSDLSEARGQLVVATRTLSSSLWAVRNALGLAEDVATDPDNDTPPPAAAEPGDMEEPTLEELEAIEEGTEEEGSEEVTA